ncbi:MAG: hypothetical protein PVG54_14420 [Anaerolineae bacterium]|jgi:hypothetical protein
MNPSRDESPHPAQHAATPEPEWPADEVWSKAQPPRQAEIIAATIADLAVKQQRLSALIDHCLEKDAPSLRELVRLLALHGQNASRLGRLLRDQQALSDPAADELSQAIDLALDELSAEWGVEL